MVILLSLSLWTYFLPPPVLPLVPFMPHTSIGVSGSAVVTVGSLEFMSGPNCENTYYHVGIAEVFLESLYLNANLCDTDTKLCFSPSSVI